MKKTFIATCIFMLLSFVLIFVGLTLCGDSDLGDFLTISGCALAAICLLVDAIAIIIGDWLDKKRPLPSVVCKKCKRSWKRSAVGITNDCYGVPWWTCPRCEAEQLVPEEGEDNTNELLEDNLTTACPHCGAEYEYDEKSVEREGFKINCPECDAEIVLP